MKRATRPGPMNYKEARTASEVLRALFTIAEQKRIYQKTLAKEIGVYYQTIQKYRMGHSSPDILTVEALANALGYELTLRKKQNDPEPL